MSVRCFGKPSQSFSRSCSPAAGPVRPLRPIGSGGRTRVASRSSCARTWSPSRASTGARSRAPGYATTPSSMGCSSRTPISAAVRTWSPPSETRRRASSPRDGCLQRAARGCGSQTVSSPAPSRGTSRSSSFARRWRRNRRSRRSSEPSSHCELALDLLHEPDVAVRIAELDERLVAPSPRRQPLRAAVGAKVKRLARLDAPRDELRVRGFDVGHAQM